jgi:hypothetical protein
MFDRMLKVERRQNNEFLLFHFTTDVILSRHRNVTLSQQYVIVMSHCHSNTSSNNFCTIVIYCVGTLPGCTGMSYL